MSALRWNCHSRQSTDLHKGKEITSDPKLLKLVALKLQDAVFKGFGKDFTSVDWDTPDAEMLHKLTQNVWHFSSAKNYQELKDLTLALKDSKGKLRTFTDFREQALKINDKYNNVWLKTEYTQIVLSSTSAARWIDFMKNVKDMPNLQYSTVGDNNVRTTHQLLDGIVKRYDSTFWNYYYPPNGYLCRCDVLQLLKRALKETKDGDIPNIVIPAMFKTNIAKTGLIFPKAHPYYKGVPDDVYKAGVKARLQVQRKVIKTWAKTNLVNTNKTVKHKKIDGDIKFTTTGIKEALNQPHKHILEKNEAIHNIVHLIKNAEYVRTDDDVKGRKAKYHYLKIQIEKEDSFIVIKEHVGKIDFYSIIDKIKE